MQVVVTLDLAALSAGIPAHEAASRMLRELCARMMADEEIDPQRLRITNGAGVDLATVALHEPARILVGDEVHIKRRGAAWPGEERA